MLEAVISTTIDGEVLAISPIRLGTIPVTERTPDHYIVVYNALVRASFQLDEGFLVK